jgi:site-specific recombinase XerD
MTDGINGYLTTLQVKGYAAGTIRYQRNHLEHFQKYLGQRAITMLTEVTTQTIIGYLATLTDRNLKRTSVISHLNALRQFFAYLCRQKQLDHNPTLKVEFPKPQKILKDVPTEAEIRQILAVPDLRTPIGIRDRAILELLYSTGLRRQEAINLNLTDVDRENGQVFVYQGKNHKDRMVPLGETAAQFVEAYLKLVRWWFVHDPKENALFIDSQKGSRLHPQTLNHIVNKTVRQSRVPKRITPHSFRHAMATHLLQNQADIRHIQLMLGHNSVETTELYTRLAIDDLKTAYRQAHPHAQREPSH